MEVLYTEQAQRVRRGILTAFCESPEWQALGRVDEPIWTEHMLYTFWTWSVDPEDFARFLFEDSLHELYAFWSDAVPGDADDIVPELRAYFAFAERVLKYDGAGECAAVLCDSDDVPGLMRFAIDDTVRRRKRKKGCTRLVRGGASYLAT